MKSCTDINSAIPELYEDLMRGNAPSDEAVLDIVETLRSRKIVIYGAGHVGRMFRKILLELRIPLIAYVDRRAAQLSAIDDIPVHEPGFMKTLAGGEDDYAVVVAAGTMQLLECIQEDMDKLRSPIPSMNGLILYTCFSSISVLCDAREGRTRIYCSARPITSNRINVRFFATTWRPWHTGRTLMRPRTAPD